MKVITFFDYDLQKVLLKMSNAEIDQAAYLGRNLSN